MGTTPHNLQRSPRTYLRPEHLAYAGFFVVMLLSALALTLPFPLHFLPFAAVFGAIFVAGALRYPYFGLYLYLIIFFIDPNTVFSFMQTVAFPYEKLIAIMVIASLFIYIAVIKKEFEVFRVDVAFFAMIVLSIESATSW